MEEEFPVVPPDRRAFETDEMGGEEFLRRLAELKANKYYAFRVEYPRPGYYKLLCLDATHLYDFDKRHAISNRERTDNQPPD